MTNISLDDIAKRLNDSGMPPGQLDEKASRLILATLKLISTGETVSRDDVLDAGNALGVTEEETDLFIKTATERDENGNILGTFGLTQKEVYRHQIFINKQDLKTWCAWDTLFIPVFLNQSAIVISSDPFNNHEIHLTVSPEGIISYEPSSTVVSMVLPSEDVKDAGTVYKIFCSQVLFFSSQESLSSWFKGNDYDPILISLQDGFELGLKTFKKIIQYV